MTTFFNIIKKTSFLPLLLWTSTNILSQPISNKSPSWATQVVWYQLVPERFYNSEKINDPRFEDIIGSLENFAIKEWNTSPWEADWHQLQSWEKSNNNTSMYELLCNRRYGGDLQGIINKLDYIKQLGITAICLTPLFTSPSTLKFDSETFHHVDPNLGPDPDEDKKSILEENPLDPTTWVWTKADLLAIKLIEEAHKRNIKICFSLSVSFMGYNSFAFKDVRSNQNRSFYKDWFHIYSFSTQRGGSFHYKGFKGSKLLPVLRLDDTTSNEPKKYIFNALSRWIKPNSNGLKNGVDGFIFSEISDVGHQFWKELRTYVKEINPELLLTAELNRIPKESSPFLQGDEFDGEINYNFAFACSDYFFEPKNRKISASNFDKRLQRIRKDIPFSTTVVTINSFNTYQTNRIGSHIVNRGMEYYGNYDLYSELSKPANTNNYNTRKPSNNELSLQKLFIIFQMTYIGTPLIFYGDEIGMWGGNYPDNIKPMLWEEMKYQTEQINIDGTKKKEPDKVEPNIDLLNFYRKIIYIRNASNALLKGDYETLLTDDKHDLYIFKRSYEDESVVVCINNSEQKAKLELPDISIRGFIDLLNGDTFVSKHGKTTVTIPPKWGLILKEL